MTSGDYTFLVLVLLPLAMLVAFIVGAVFQRRQDERDACAHDCGHYEHTSGDDTKFVWGKKGGGA